MHIGSIAQRTRCRRRSLWQCVISHDPGGARVRTRSRTCVTPLFRSQRPCSTDWRVEATLRRAPPWLLATERSARGAKRGKMRLHSTGHENRRGVRDARRRTTTVAVSTLAATLLGVGLWTLGCGGTEGTETGVACAQSTLIAQCPPGSDPRLDAEARSICSGEGSVDLIEQNGRVTGSCEGEGSCQVLCQFSVPCECGVDSITNEGIFCTPCSSGSACGNGVCEAGESPESCPVDCAAVCVEGRQRCNGDAREECSLQGRWETLACPSGDTCRPSADEPGEVECVPAR
jgi:hypothetical protein